MKNVTFPVLSANIDASLEPEMAPLLAPSTVLDVGGEKIGVIGYTTKDTPVLSYPGIKWLVPGKNTRTSEYQTNLG